jgi:hypothetical protein
MAHPSGSPSRTRGVRLLLVRRDKWLSGVESLFYQFLVVGFLPVFPAFENLPISRDEIETFRFADEETVFFFDVIVVNLNVKTFMIGFCLTFFVFDVDNPIIGNARIIDA